MDLQDIVNSKMTAMRVERLKDSPMLTLGELILKLEAIPKKESPVEFDFGSLVPTTLDSWRGSYSELALGFTEGGNCPSVETLLVELRGAIGKIFTGYKGGDYKMGKNTPVWVSNYGRASNTAIVDVKDLGGWVILQTAYEEY